MISLQATRNSAPPLCLQAWCERKRGLRQPQRAKADAIGDEPLRQRVVAQCDEDVRWTGKDSLDTARLFVPARMWVERAVAGCS